MRVQLILVRLKVVQAILIVLSLVKVYLTIGIKAIHHLQPYLLIWPSENPFILLKGCILLWFQDILILKV